MMNYKKNKTTDLLKQKYKLEDRIFLQTISKDDFIMMERIYWIKKDIEKRIKKEDIKIISKMIFDLKGNNFDQNTLLNHIYKVVLLLDK